ncbi:MAG: hypothetical protein Q7S48_02490 [bacterium]|nr:hypothetical protein [bacterium]
MKHKIALYAFVPVFALSLLGVRAASAHGIGHGMGMGMFGGFSSRTPEEISVRQQSMFAHQAQILGITVDDMKTAQTEQIKVQLKALVDKAVITQAQADTRLTAMQARMEAGNGKGRMKGLHFFRR